MSNIKRILQTELKAYKKIVSKFIEELGTAPEGSLSVSRINGGEYLHYYNKRRSIHLSLRRPDDLALAKQLRRKKFVQKSLKVLDHDIPILEKAAGTLIGYDPKAISDELAKGYQMIPGREKEVLTGFEPRTHSFYTFRSKSEQIIALTLEANGLQYMYEMDIIANRKHYRPDFVILHPVTHELIYWEHFGLITDRDYYMDNIERMMDYHTEDIILGINFLFTTETKEKPLTAGQVQSVIDLFFN